MFCGHNCDYNICNYVLYRGLQPPFYVLLAKRSHITFCLLITFSLLCVQSTFVLHIPQGTIMKIRSMQTCIMSSLPRCIFKCSVFRYVTLVSFFFQTLLFNCNSFTLVANKYLITYLFTYFCNVFYHNKVSSHRSTHSYFWVICRCSVGTIGS